MTPDPSRRSHRDRRREHRPDHDHAGHPVTESAPRTAAGDVVAKQRLPHTESKRSILLGALFLMATSAIGPGFITQTANFTVQLGAAFAFAILLSILVDIAVQLNVWRVIGVSGLRANQLAGALVPGLGAVLAVFVVFGGFVFNVGNVAGAVADEKVVTANGVTILGYTDLPARLPTQASQLYGTNVVNMLTLMTPEKDGQLVIDLDDVVVRGMTVTSGGETLWPPPPVQVSAAATAASPAPAAGGASAPEPAAKAPMSPAARWGAIGAAALVFLLVMGFAPPAILANVTVFMLAVVIGYYVIGNVHHALHTPLMSVTNAISGIILIGAMTQITDDDPIIQVIAFLAVLLASINVFGGFTVTQRMLSMFRKA